MIVNGLWNVCIKMIFVPFTATHSATRALALKPNWYEALYARARVLRESQHLTEALNDVLSAERSAPDHNLRDIRRLIERIKDEIRKGEYRWVLRIENVL